jgi:hypothetical protein
MDECVSCKATIRERNLPSMDAPESSRKETRTGFDKCTRDLRTPDFKFQGANDEKCERTCCALKKSDHIKDEKTENFYCPGSIWGYTQYCCNCLTMFDCHSKFNNFDFHAFDLEKEGCSQCKQRDKSWKWFGIVVSTSEYKPSDTFKPIWYRVEGDGNFLPDIRPVPDAKKHPKVEPAQVVGLEFPKHLTELPTWLYKFSNLARLRINACTMLPASDAYNLAFKVESIKSLECAGCAHLTRLPENLRAARIPDNAGIETLKILKPPRSSQ